MSPEDEARAAPLSEEDLRWTPLDGPNVDDSCITVALIGRKPEQFWAKAVGRDPEFGDCIGSTSCYRWSAVEEAGMADVLLSSAEALANATRLLQYAEDDLMNPARMEALTRLSETWVSVAGLLHESE